MTQPVLPLPICFHWSSVRRQRKSSAREMSMVALTLALVACACTESSTGTSTRMSTHTGTGPMVPAKVFFTSAMVLLQVLL